MNSPKLPESQEGSTGLLADIVALRSDDDLRNALSVWRAHLLKRSFERLVSDIEPSDGLDGAMVRLHHHFAVELPITEIGTILPNDKETTVGIEGLDQSALRPLFAIREKIATSAHSEPTKYDLGELLRRALASSSSEPLAKYREVSEKGLRDHCPGNSLAERKGDGGFDFSEIIDRITK